MSVALLGAVSPIHMIGESHSLAFGNLLFRPDGSTDSFLCRTKFLATLRAKHYGDGENVSQDYIDELIAEGIVDAQLRPAFLHAEPSAAYLAAAPLTAPPMVLFTGDLDLHDMFRMLGDKHDFLLPDDPGYGVDETKQILSYADVRDHIVGFLLPFFSAIEQLRRVGFSRMIVHCIPPRTPDDAVAARWTGAIVVPAPLRAKLTLLANRALAEFCETAGFPFIDTWPELTENGFLKPEFELDGCHVNRKSTLVSLGKIAAALFDQTDGVWNPARYHFAAAQSEPVERSAHAVAWEEDGLVHAAVDPAFVRRALATLSFDQGHENRRARPDWSGRPREGLAGLSLAEPSQDLLDAAAALLGEGEGAALLHAGSANGLTVTSFRPVRYAATTQDVLPLAAPPQTRRALLVLDQADRIAFAPLAEDVAAIATPALAAGTLVVYDPHRLTPLLFAGEEDLRVIELAIAPRLAGQPFRVISSGLCDWPADPYCFSVQGMTAAPDLTAPLFHARPIC